MKRNVKRLLSFILATALVIAIMPIISKPMVAKADTTQETNHTHGAHADGSCSDHAGWTPISTEAELITLCNNGGKGYLTSDISIIDDLAGYIEIPEEKEVYLCLNGFCILQTEEGGNYSGAPIIGVSGKLYLYDEINNSGRITEIVYVTHYSGVTIGGGGTFIMNGGEISGIKSRGIGAGVNVLNGTFIMNGGKIYDNGYELDGGGVRVLEGCFTMNGGEISGNCGVFRGVAVDSGCTFTMNGGKIFGNENGYGIGVLGTFIMNGGYIFDSISCSTVNVYSVSLDANGGPGNQINQYYIDSNVKLAPNSFTRTGYTFIGWNTENDGTGTNYADEASLTNAGNLTLYAQWAHNYTVRFDANGGSGSMSDMSRFANDNTALTSNTFTREGYTFAGWNTAANGSGTSYDDGATINFVTTVNETVTLFAKWIQNDYTVKFNANGGSGSMLDMSRKYDDNTALTTNAFTKEGYTFAGWNTVADGSGTGYSDESTDNITATSNATVNLYAQWTPYNYTVKFDANGGTGTMADQSRAYDDSTPLTANAFSLEGSTFSGWNTQADGSGTSYADGTTDNLTSTDGDTVTLYAQWNSISYNIAVTNDGNGTASASATSGIKGTNITLTATPNEGYKFAKWEVVSGGITLADASSATTTFTIGTSNIEVKATFEEIPPTVYSVTVSNDGNGTATASVTSGIEGTEVTVTATPNEGYKFAGWEVVSGGVTLADAASATTTFVIGTENVEIKANFEEIKEPEPEDPEPKEPDPEPKNPDPIPEKDWLDDLRLALNIAAELGGTQTVEYSGDFALPLEIMEFLKVHPLITLVYHVTYEDVEYTVTIKGSNAIADSTILWYGPLWLLANYGGNKAPNGIAGNGTYVVKSGDTLAAISVRLGVTVQYLVDKNKIKNPDVIYEGQVIYY